MWEHAELSEIRAFLVLCEELHFGRTAQRLGISQTRVSQIIRALEDKLAGPLFERTSRRVAITPRAERLRADIGAPYHALRDVLRDTYEHGRAINGELRLGVLFPSSGGPALSRIITLFETRHPACRVVVSESRFDDPLGPLRRGEIDVMAIRLPICQPDLTVGPVLVRDERLVAVSVNNPLAGRDSVSIEDLADHEAHDAGGELPPEYIDALVPPRTPAGRQIRRRHITSPTPTHVLSLVARDEIIHPSVASLPDYVRHPGVAYVPIRDLPDSSAGLAWLTTAESAAIRALAQAVIDTVGEDVPTITNRARSPAQAGAPP